MKSPTETSDSFRRFTIRRSFILWRILMAGVRAGYGEEPTFIMKVRAFPYWAPIAWRWLRGERFESVVADECKKRGVSTKLEAADATVPEDKR